MSKQQFDDICLAAYSVCQKDFIDSLLKRYEADPVAFMSCADFIKACQKEISLYVASMIHDILFQVLDLDE